MADLVTRAQITMLAQLLDVEPAAVSGLERLGADQVEALRTRISDSLFDSLAAVFARVSKLAPLVPDAVAATVAVKAIPAEVAGRGGGAIGMDHQHRAAGLMSRMPPGYLADAAPYVDPRVIPFFAPKLPFALLIPAADELLRRRDYITAARFVEHATDDLIRAFERHVQDDEAIVLTGAMVSRTEVLNSILRTVSPERRARVVALGGSGKPDVLVAALSLLARVDAEFAAPMTAMLFESQDAEGVSRLCELAVAAGATAELLDVIGYLPDETVRVLAAAPGLPDTGMLEQAATTERRAAAVRRLIVCAPEPHTGTLHN
ncbi:hypothetical protein ACFVUS_06000 [Nocardia sp. NPDC058058]|uniref:hypothetical protein n=1 Tax=Nocardia sp. NPDC058058 TaxID=3346317 RepID=UPI0036DA1827